MSKYRYRGIGSKYRNVRTSYKGVRYDSKAEAEWASKLDLRMRAGEVTKWYRQVFVQLGEQIITRVDFKVWDKNGTHYEEVKGAETRAFSQVRRWWTKYGPAPLHIWKKKGKTWTEEVLKGARMAVEN